MSKPVIHPIFNLTALKGQPLATPVKLDDLIDAYEWVSAAGSFENFAYVNKVTGEIFIQSDEADEEPPNDYEDASVYVAVPHKNDLGLGKSLVMQYVDEMLPERSEDVWEFFRRRGAYSRFKDLLERNGILNAWYQYETRAIEQALRKWSLENGLQLACDND